MAVVAVVPEGSTLPEAEERWRWVEPAVEWAGPVARAGSRQAGPGMAGWLEGTEWREVAG